MIRPVPSSFNLENNDDLSYNADDDEMFLDEDEAIETAKRLKKDNSKSTTNSTTATFASQLPSTSNSKLTNTATYSRSKLENKNNAHVIYKRNMFNPESHSDYRKFQLFSNFQKVIEVLVD